MNPTPIRDKRGVLMFDGPTGELRRSIYAIVMTRRVMMPMSPAVRGMIKELENAMYKAIDVAYELGRDHQQGGITDQGQYTGDQKFNIELTDSLFTGDGDGRTDKG